CSVFCSCFGSYFGSFCSSFRSFFGSAFCSSFFVLFLFFFFLCWFDSSSSVWRVFACCRAIVVKRYQIRYSQRCSFWYRVGVTKNTRLDDQSKTNTTTTWR